MNEDKGGVSEEIGALCALIVEVKATVEREQQFLVAMGEKLDKGTERLIEGMYLVLSQNAPVSQGLRWWEELLGMCVWGVIGFLAGLLVAYSLLR